MCTCSVWASLVQKQRPFSTPKSRIQRRLTTAQRRARWRRRIKRRWRRRRWWRHVQLQRSRALMGLWKRRILYSVDQWQYRLVLPLAATAAPLPPGSTSSSTPSASLPGTAAWPTPLRQLVAAVSIRPPCSAFRLHLLLSTTAPHPSLEAAAERAVPRAGGATGSRGASRMPQPWRATRLCPSRLLTTRSWSAPSVASASPRPRRTSLGLLSL